MICYGGDYAQAADFVSRGAFNTTQMNDMEVRAYSGLKLADSFADFWSSTDVAAYRGGVTGFYQPGSL